MNKQKSSATGLQVVRRVKKQVGRPKASLGRLARTLLAVLFEQLDELDPYLPPLHSERALMRWCYERIRGNYETALDRRFARAIRSLRQHGLLATHNGKILLAPEARIYWHEYQLETFALRRSKRWDELWRIVIWDIPESRKSKREVLRNLLRRIGFAQIQRSVWVVPWPCRDEIAYIRERLNLGPSVLFLETNSIDGQQYLRDRFGLK